MRWKQQKSVLWGLAIAAVLVLASARFVSSGFAAEEKEKKNLPERAIVVYPEYTGVVISGDKEDLSLDLTVANRGRNDEDVLLSVTSVPKGWQARIKTYSYGVTGVHVESDKTRSLTLKLKRDKTVGPGEYRFGIRARTPDGKFDLAREVTVVVKGKRGEKKEEGVKITTSYPVLRGPTDAKFEFSLDVENELDKDTTFNLSFQGPKNWEINFKPAYEDKFFSSLRLKANQSQSIAVAVKPYPLATPGEYPIRVRVSSPEAKGEALLKVVLTGTYKLDAGTPNGLLSLRAQRGKEANLSVYVRNSGSATLENVHFISVKPENWKVKFKPEKIETLAPDELKQVEVSIIPAAQALVGDYSVGITADAGRVSKDLELRVTAMASSTWGWIGIGIIVLVVAGLVGLFIRLGRR